eukprot:TRINITY_DN13435_c0_g1_i1.p1 TRINITY_DN13435_c0_g1~~TRINITY_DN13435_c0_g1_i1.p1  ORF type:complete len:283 (-),score=54.55 TRINITY_DN13435_c0_g1_i1:42-890(-)
MLHKSNLVALVGGGAPPKFAKNKVVIWDDIQFQSIAELAFQSEVKAVKLRRDRIVVVLEKKVYVYDLTNLNLLDQIDTCANPSGLAAISSMPSDIILATLGEKVGEVRVSIDSKLSTTSIMAHATQITQLVLNPSGTRLATSSEKGTIIRVFDTLTGTKVCEFRRGTQPAVIHSLAFNFKATMLCASSSSGTVHIYSCGDQLDNKTSSFSVLKGWVPLAGDVWSAKQIYIQDSHSISAFAPDEGNKHVIIILGSTGNYYKYTYTDDATDITQENFAALTVMQ